MTLLPRSKEAQFCSILATKISSSASRHGLELISPCSGRLTGVQEPHGSSLGMRPAAVDSLEGCFDLRIVALRIVEIVCDDQNHGFIIQ